MTLPMQRCLICGDREIVRPIGEFPPAVALSRLAKRCKNRGHVCDHLYTAGITI
jgi:hypothetical protein